MNESQIKDVYPLSPLQEGMLFHTLSSPGSGMYLEQWVYAVEGPLDRAAFQDAWQQVVHRHDILRTAFVWKELNQPLQVVMRRASPRWQHLDWRAQQPDNRYRALDAFLRADRQHGFATDEAPLMRMTLIQLTEESYRFIWSWHHMLLDAWSVALVLQEVCAYYRASLQRSPLSLPEPRPYKSYIARLSTLSPASPAFWRQYLHAATPLSSLPLESRHHATTDEYAELTVTLAPDLTDRLNAFARRHRLTVSTILQSAWGVLLGRHCATADVLFGLTVSGRALDLAGVEDMVGLFINTLPCRVQIHPTQSLLAWLHDLQSEQTGLREHEHDSLTRIQEWSGLPRTMPLFESTLVVENHPAAPFLLSTADPPLELQPIQAYERGNYPLTLVVSLGPPVTFRGLYNPSRFEQAAVALLLRQLGALLENMVASPPRALAHVSMLAEEERQQVIEEWGRARASYPHEHCLHQLFEAHAARTPAAIALTDDGRQLSYQDLNQLANQLARFLRRRGVRPATVVALYLDRSVDLVVAILASLKAGAAYVPLDPHSPAARLALLLADSQAPVLLTQESLRSTLPAHQAQVLCLEEVRPAIAQEALDNLALPTNPQQLAYLIYTSGSTGTPKAVMVSHANVTRLFAATAHWAHFSAQDVWTLFHSAAFDFSVWELWGALLYGARLVLIPYWVSRSPQDFDQLLRREQVTVLNQTPSAFAQVVALDMPAPPAALRLVIFGGEALDAAQVRRWLDRSGEQRPQLINMYGITETTVHVTAHPLTRAGLAADEQGIGRPLPDLEVYLLDAVGQPVPVGVAGELYVGGAGVSRGYLHRPALTAERFVPHPFSRVPGARLYRTGDRARYRPDGQLTFLGRVDRQVKIRGFRVELGEIETRLREQPEVREAVVSLHTTEQGDRQLVAYVVPCRRDGDLAQELRSRLGQQLPDYMVPATIVLLDQLPLTANGKVDYSALPAPRDQVMAPPTPSAAPRTPVEQQLAAIWQSLLHRDFIGIHDSFFDVGGHSVLLIQLVSRLADTFGVSLSVRSVFGALTIEEQGQLILSKQVEQENRETVQDMLARLTQLSDEEVKRLLETGG